MIRNLLITGFMLFSLPGLAQFVPNNSQGFQFMSMYNPAFSGMDEFTDIRLGYRYQWAGLNGAPKYANLSLNTRLKQPFDITTNALRISNLKGLDIPAKKLLIHGLGVNVFQASYGQVQTIGGGLNYSLHFSLSRKLKLATGVGVIIQNTKIDISKVAVRDPDRYYDYLLSNGFSKTDLNVRAGVLLYSSKFYLGITYLPLIQKSFQLPDSTSEGSIYTASAQAGVSLQFSPAFLLKPSVLAMIYSDNSVAIDYNVKAFVGNRVWFGLSYRDIQAAVIMLGFNVNSALAVSYSYEMSMGKFKTFNDGSHEIVLAVKLNNFKRLDPYTW